MAIGATTSAFVALAAAAVPPGAEVVVVDGDFASVVRPFLARGDLRVTQVPLAGLAEAVGPDTWLVAYALVPSGTGEVADAAAVRSAAAMTKAGIIASGRAGRARVSFHLWNDLEDVDLAATALGR